MDPIDRLTSPVPAQSQGCDASVLLSGPDDEHSAGADTTLCTGRAGPRHPRQGRVSTPTHKCAYKVSCADIIALAGRDVDSQVLYFPWRIHVR